MTTSSSTGTKGLGIVWRNWSLGMLAALVFAGLVGLAVYYLVDSANAKTIDEKVQQKLAEQAPKGGGPKVPPTKVRVATVQTMALQRRIPVVGRLQEVRRSVIASEVEGKVVKLLTPAGREVVGGETVIARVDPVWARLLVKQAEADLAAADVLAKRSKTEAERVAMLNQRGSADDQAVVDAKAQADADAAAVLSLQAALSRAEEAESRVEIIAPFDGRVTKKLTEQGQWLDPGSAVVEIVSRGLIDAVIDVPEQYITSIKIGTTIQLSITALGLTIDGDVKAINPDGLNPSRSYPVKVRIDDRDGLLKIGMSVTAMVPVGEKAQYMVVPKDAVQRGENSKQVWISLVMPNAEPGSMPQAMPMDVVQLFEDSETQVYAIRPMPKVDNVILSAGMEVVTEGAERLWPMRPLIVMPPAGGGEQEPEGADVKAEAAAG